jgi:hypothetical protein
MRPGRGRTTRFQRADISSLSVVEGPRAEGEPVGEARAAPRPLEPEGIGAVNDFHVKLVKLRGEFVWHSHDVEDELFLVLVVLLVAIGLVLLTRHAAARRWLA